MIQKLNGYEVHRNKHGVPYQAGPRQAGPHKVFDHWNTTPVTQRMRGPATVMCYECGAVWNEGAEYPEQCWLPRPAA